MVESNDLPRVGLVGVIVILLFVVYNTLTSDTREEMYSVIVWGGAVALGGVATLVATFLKQETGVIPDREVEYVPHSEEDIRRAMESVATDSEKSLIRGSARTTRTRIKAASQVRIPFADVYVEGLDTQDSMPYLIGILVFFLSLGVLGLEFQLGPSYLSAFLPAAGLFYLIAEEVKHRRRLPDLPRSRRKTSNFIRSVLRPTEMGGNLAASRASANDRRAYTPAPSAASPP